jgi:hypothetical protein
VTKGKRPSQGKTPMSPNTMKPMKLRNILHSYIITKILKTITAKLGEGCRQATQAGHSTDEFPIRESPIQGKTPWRYIPLRLSLTVSLSRVPVFDVLEYHPFRVTRRRISYCATEYFVQDYYPFRASRSGGRTRKGL